MIDIQMQGQLTDESLVKGEGNEMPEGFGGTEAEAKAGEEQNHRASRMCPGSERTRGVENTELSGEGISS